ncbi:MAG: Abi family protein [Alphaproteobacteria bacterium]|nr:Abi family protein [Alphaproteobacteria bacterium]
MNGKQPFSKPYLDVQSQVTLLQSRGLEIPDTQKAEKYLNYIGYYRLSAYMFPFLTIPKQQHQYKKGATFDKVMMLYRFDKKLRLLIFNEIEKIEVAIRNIITATVCEGTNNPFWMTDQANYANNGRYTNTLAKIDAEIQHSNEEFITHFQNTYSDNYPPAWMLTEILPLGILTNIYNNLKDKRLKKQIAQKFGLQIAPFQSWMTIITLTRNACCHHRRVWNKQNTIRPTLPNSIQYPWITLNVDYLKIYFNLCIIKYFLNIISPQNDMTNKLKTLLATFPEIDTAAMGFPKGWENEPVWC